MIYYELSGKLVAVPSFSFVKWENFWAKEFPQNNRVELRESLWQGERTKILWGLLWGKLFVGWNQDNKAKMSCQSHRHVARFVVNWLQTQGIQALFPAQGQIIEFFLIWTLRGRSVDAKNRWRRPWKAKLVHGPVQLKQRIEIEAVRSTCQMLQLLIIYSWILEGEISAPKKSWGLKFDTIWRV